MWCSRSDRISGTARQTSVDRFSAGFASRIQPEPRDLRAGASARQSALRAGRQSLPAARALDRARRVRPDASDHRRYGPVDPPVRWIVTANWPPLRMGPWKLPSPGDWLLPRVAQALAAIPVAFAGTNPEFTARTLRRLLRDARTLDCPIGLFPEGAAGTAGRLVRLPSRRGPAAAAIGKIGLAPVPAASGKPTAA